MLPTEGRDMGQNVVWYDLATGSHFGDGLFEICGVPQNDGSHDQVEARRAKGLIFEGSIPQFAELVEEDGSGQGVSRLALVQNDLNLATEGGVAQPVEEKEGPFYLADFVEGASKGVLPRIGCELGEQGGGRRLPTFYGGGETQDLRPIVSYGVCGAQADDFATVGRP